MISSYPIQTWSAGTIEKLTIIDIILTIRFYTIHQVDTQRWTLIDETKNFIRDRYWHFFWDQICSRPTPNFF